jgi:hypothetical protein
MSEYDLKQVKADLDTIWAATGIMEGPDRHDLKGNLLLALSGIITTGWAMLSHGIWQVWGLLAVLLPMGYIIRLRSRHRKDVGGSPQVRREFRAACAVLALAVPFVGYALWAQWMGIKPELALATTVFFVGMMMLSGVIARPGQSAIAPWCLAFMGGALAMPVAPLSPVGLIGLMLLAGGLSSACLIQIQLQGASNGISG